MSGTFERTAYDAGAYAAQIKQSTAPLLYALNPIFANPCNPCRVGTVGYISKVGVSLTKQRPLIDVESDLKNLDRHYSKDPNQKYRPSCPKQKSCNEGYPCGGGVVNGCGNSQEKLFHFPTCDLGGDYTRTSNPTCTMRETGVNRFTPLCLQPQDEDRWLHPSEIGISYRNVVKDNHVPCIPRPVDQTLALPKGGKLPCQMIQPSCGNYLGALHPTYEQLNRNWNGLN